MPSRGNPNVPTKLKRKASRVKVQKHNAKNKISKNPRGTAPTNSIIFPSSGPGAPLSGKKARKVQRALNHARQRALEEAMVKEGEVVMTDAPKTTKAKENKTRTEDDMELDGVA
ncbi:MAG: hypothetical protein M1818_000345 [Claussenomyces sp. TS43310]|nr:MAG: hypothetical protein M1818_000345 [Claussenomyces sp. TS43310]